MKWQEEDISLLDSASDEFGDYLTSQIINWNINSSRLVLTPGRVLLAIKRLSAISNNDAKISELIVKMTNRINTKRVLWQKKVDLEIPRRLRVWENSLKDYREEGLDQSYAAQVVNRVILNLLEKNAYSLPPSFETRLHTLDEVIRTLLIPGDFIWDEQIKAEFPITEYWYLYARVKEG